MCLRVCVCVCVCVCLCVCVRRLGLDKEVVDAARERLDSNVSIADDNITELETLRTQLQDEETAL